MNRRDFLRTSAQAAAVLAAAACSSSAGGDRSPSSSSPSTLGPGTTTTTRGGAPSLEELAARLHGRVVTPLEGDFSIAHALYNPIYDSIAPRAVIQAADAADVETVVGLMRDYGTGVAIRGGGHSYGGWSTGTDLVLDVTQLRAIKVDKPSNTVQVGPGVRLHDLYSTLNPQGLTIPAGTCPTVGITGLTLGGGYGLVSRAMGLTCDSLLAVDIVTADGQLRHCDARENSDLFWALRGGGGGSFGVVTNLTYALHAAPATVTTFLVEYAWNEAANGLAAWMAWVPGLPAQTTAIARLETTPVLVVAGVHLGTRDETRQILAPLYAAAPTIQRSATERSFTDAMLLEESCLHNRQAQCAPTPPTGASPVLGTRSPFVATSQYFDRPLPATAINAAITAANTHLATAGSGLGTLQFDAYGGAIAAVAPSATAFSHRYAFCSAQYASLWTDPTSPDPHRAWLRATRATMAPWADGGAYVNYADPEISGYAHAYWGGNLARLQQVKKKYDPHNIFSFPQSVPLP